MPDKPVAAPPRWLRLLALPLTLVAFGGLALLAIQPPSPLPVDAPAAEFSAARALEHMSWIAAEPHPLGSPAHARVRERLVAELEALGLEVHLQRTEVIYDYARRPDVTRMATVTNVLARRPGTGTEGGRKALALMAHYDSVPHAPGAADDGSGVATILEALRALDHGPPLANDVLAVITDGEERGLLGAQAFVRQHPWAEEVGLVLNFEARGIRGPVFMFETSEGNAPLIEALAEAAPAPLANSLSYAIYRRLPNDTDLSITKAAGIPGLNFAFNDGFYDYHTARDRPVFLSPASVQHAGSYALALARHFGNADLAALSPEPRAPDATYFNTVGFHLVRYPMSWVPWLSGGTLLLLGLVLGLAFLRNGIGLGGVLRGLLAFVLHLGVSVALLWTTSALLGRIAGGPETRFRTLLAHDHLLLFGFVLWIAAAAFLIWRLLTEGLPLPGLRRPVPVLTLSLGGLCGWGVLLLLCTPAVPGAAFLLTWPLLAAVTAHGIVLWCRPGPTLELCLLTGGAIPAVLWMVPYAHFFFVALGVAQPAVALLPAMLLAGQLVPAALALEITSRRLAWGACLMAGAGLLVGAALVSPFDRRHPKPVELFVWHDVDFGEVWWASPESQPDGWTREILGAEPERKTLDRVLPGAQSPLWIAPTSAGSLWLPRLEAPEVEMEEAGEETASRRRFRLAVPRGAEAVALSLPADAGIRAAWLDGAPVTVQEPNDGWWRWWYFNLPPEGVEIALELEDPTRTFEAHLATVAYRWPEPLRDLLTQRPANRMPRPRSLADATVVTRTFVVRATGIHWQDPTQPGESPETSPVSPTR